MSQTKARGVTVKGTKTDSARTIPLSRVALEALKRVRVRVQQAADKLRLGVAYKGSGFIFTDEAWSVLSPMAVTSAYARMARRAGISSTRIHDARHTAASRMLASGVDIRTVSAILGHASAVISLGIYAHLLGESTRSAIDILGDALDAEAN